MAVAFLATTTFIQVNGAGTDTTTLPGTPVEDDIVVVSLACDSAIPSAPIVTSGYTAVVDTVNGVGLETYWKRMGSTPDTNVETKQQSTKYIAGLIQTFSGVDTTTAIDTTSDTDGGASGYPNSPSHTTTIDDSYRIIVGALDDDDDAANATTPSGWTNFDAGDTGQSSSTKGCTIMQASKAGGALGADDPDAFTGSGSDQWASAHFALREGAAAGPTEQALAATATGVATIVTLLSAFRDLGATAIGVAAIATLLSAFVLLSATAVGSAVLTALMVMGQTLAATAVGVATISTFSKFFRTLAATSIGTAVLDATKLVGAATQQALAATAIGVANIATRLKAFRTLAATAIGIAGVGRKATFFVLLSVTVVCLPGIASSTAAISFVSMAAVAVGVATLVALYLQFFAPFSGGGGLGYSHRRKWKGPRRGWGRK